MRPETNDNFGSLENPRDTPGPTRDIENGSFSAQDSPSPDIAPKTAVKRARGNVTISDTEKAVRQAPDDPKGVEPGPFVIVPDKNTLTISPSEAAKDPVALGRIVGSHTLTVSGALDDFAALSAAQITQLKLTGFTFDVHDSSLNIQNITAKQAATLEALGVKVLRSDAGSITLSVAQAARLAGAGLTVAASSVRLSDTPSTIARITKASADLVKSLGFAPAGSSSGPVSLSASEASVFGVSGPILDPFRLTVTGTLAELVSSPDSLQFWATNNYVLIATDLSEITKAIVDALRAANVASVGTESSVSLSAEQAGFLLENGLKIVATAPQAVVTIVDTSANLFVHSINDYAAIGASALSASDALRLNARQVADLEATGISVSGSAITLNDRSAAISALSTDQLAYLSRLHVTSISSVDGAISLSLEQVATLESGRIQFEKTSVKIVDHAEKIQVLTTERISALAAFGVSEFLSLDHGATFGAAGLKIDAAATQQHSAFVFESCDAADGATPADLASSAPVFGLPLPAYDDAELVYAGPAAAVMSDALAPASGVQAVVLGAESDFF